ncbi:MAG: GNAT family N-acetyltransferase [Kiloniellales bacterium]|nr:GNAT family N-acetyltransferase [Kiloniellales bacterium]
MAAEGELARRVEAVRAFNRFYTKQIGVLHEGFLGSDFGLAEARVIYDLAHLEGVTATELGRELDLDPGYLSRILRRLVSQDLVERQRSKNDGRQSHLRLSRRGRKAFALLDRRSRRQFQDMLARLSESDQRRLMGAIETIERLMAPEPGEKPVVVLRPHRAGDMGWVTHRHGVLYGEEHGLDESFEAMVGKVAADFVTNIDPTGERCWIAEVEGAIAGSIFLMRKSKTVAKLRLLYVEPAARGLGIGARLVDECLRFACQAGYRKVTLWTLGHLDAARGLYERRGFQCVETEPTHAFGRDLIGETWELDLKSPAP